MGTTAVHSQEVYSKIMQMSKDVAEDRSRSLTTRKIATFKVDELNYMAMKARELMPDSTMRMLDVQALAMYDYVELFIKQLTIESKKRERKAVIDLFKRITLENPRYFDMDKELIMSYINTEGYLTQFSLDTDWVKALDAVKKVLSNL
jgi:hypothetical protein